MERERKQQGMTQVYFSKSGRQKKTSWKFFFSQQLEQNCLRRIYKSEL